MQKNLLTKSKFAELAGVNPSTITRLCNNTLAAACVGKRVDAAHPAAVKYLEGRERASAEPAGPGIDILYEDTVAACDRAGSYTLAFIQREMHVGRPRARNLRDLMVAANVIPTPGAARAVVGNGADGKPVVMDRAAADRIGLVPGSDKPRGQAAVKQAKKNAPPREPDNVAEVPENIEAFADMTLRQVVARYGSDAAFVDWLRATKLIEDIHEKRLKNAATSGSLISRTVVENGLIDTINTTHKKLLTDGSKSIAARCRSAALLGESESDIEQTVLDQISSFLRPCKAKLGRLLRNA